MRLIYVLTLFAVSVAAAARNIPTEDGVESSADFRRQACPCDCVSLSYRLVPPPISNISK